MRLSKSGYKHVQTAIKLKMKGKKGISVKVVPVVMLTVFLLFHYDKIASKLR